MSTTEKEITIAEGLGDADSSQVLLGATFTSESGFSQTGTFEPTASNITYNEGTVADALDELTENVANLPSAGTKLTGTLLAGETTITLTSDKITTDTILSAVYTSIFDVQLESAVFGENSLTLTFEVQEEDMTVVALIDATIAEGKSAYEYAVDSGYEGTEEEFGSLLGTLDTTLNDINEELDNLETTVNSLISSGTTDLTAGTSTLASGTIYCVYE